MIESAGRPDAHRIKSHHNVGGLPDDMDFELVEPLRDLFKDEVRRAGIELGLPEELVWRHPFPGPGLAVRILGEITWERLEMAARRRRHFYRRAARRGPVPLGVPGLCRAAAGAHRWA